MSEILTDEEVKILMEKQINSLRARGFLAGPEDLPAMMRIFNDAEDPEGGDPLLIGPRDEVSFRRTLKEIEEGGSDD